MGTRHQPDDRRNGGGESERSYKSHVFTTIVR
jgi:hypothetical protein